MKSLVTITKRLASEVDALEFRSPVAFVYNPLDYARRSVEKYLSTYARKGVDALWLGMNPGPFGMAQTGVPFGEVSAVRDWLRIEAKVDSPTKTHPKRPIEGFACTRSEVSGQRLWGFARQRFASPEQFFVRFFVWNYCPLVFMSESGANITPDKLPRDEQRALFAACDRALQAFVEEIEPMRILGVGEFAAKRAREALAGRDLEIGSILHPSPASPAANRGWAQQAERQLAALGITF